jgi:hypothetical protein
MGVSNVMNVSATACSFEPESSVQLRRRNHVIRLATGGHLPLIVFGRKVSSAAGTPFAKATS